LLETDENFGFSICTNAKKKGKQKSQFLFPLEKSEPSKEIKEKKIIKKETPLFFHSITQLMLNCSRVVNFFFLLTLISIVFFFFPIAIVAGSIVIIVATAIQRSRFGLSKKSMIRRDLKLKPF